MDTVFNFLLTSWVSKVKLASYKKLYKNVLHAWILIRSFTSRGLNMDILRRNTDYAIRAMVHLAKHWQQEPVSTRQIAQEEDISYQLACKLMQRLHKAELIESYRGPKGGFQLCRKPSKINLLEIIETIQGPVSLNRCLMDSTACLRQSTCPVSKKLVKLQGYLETSLRDVTLDELLEGIG